MSVLNRLPLVLVSGQFQQLQAGDRLVQIILLAGTDIVAGNILTVDTITNKVSPADSSVYTIAGIACNNAAEDGEVAIATSGILTLADWSGGIGSDPIIYGAEHYVSSNAAGYMEQILPATGYVHVMGRFLSPFDFQINLGSPIRLR